MGNGSSTYNKILKNKKYNNNNNNNIKYVIINKKNIFKFIKIGLIQSIQYWIHIWLWLTGLQNDRLLVYKLIYNWKNRKNYYNGILLFILNSLQTSIKILNALLVPHIFARYLIATITLHVIYEICNIIRRNIKYFKLKCSSNGRQILNLRKQLNNANTFQERFAIGTFIDQLEGHDQWRLDPKSNLFQFQRVSNKIQMYKRLQQENDILGLMFSLRAGLLRKHWGLGNSKLYNVSYVGTKHIIEDYMETIVQSIEQVIKAKPEFCHSDITAEELSIENKLAFFNETRHAFGRSALLLSGGGAAGLYHAGVVKSLVEHNLLPTVISGASAGSIVAGIMGVRTDEEIGLLFENGNINLKFFDVNIDSDEFNNHTLPFGLNHIKYISSMDIYNLLSRLSFIIKRFKEKNYILDIEILKACLRHNIGDYTFREAYDRSGRIVNITVTPAQSSDYPQLLNYLTAPNVLVWSASLASCAIPMVFSSVEILAKDKYGNITPYSSEGLKWTDGSVECDLPMERLSELFNVNHFIVSQVNPHYRILVGSKNFYFEKITNMLDFLKKQMKAYVSNIVNLGLNTKVLKFFGFGVIPLLTQRYEGDITICPNARVSLIKMIGMLLKNPTQEEFINIVKIGEITTWPYISRIRTLCRIEFALEKAVRQLRMEQTIENVKRGNTMSIGRVPSFYTIKSRLNLTDLEKNNTSPLSSQHSQIRRNRSINVAGAVMTMENISSYGSENSFY